MIAWTGEIAADWLAKNGFKRHYRKMKSANFSVPGDEAREIAIALGRKESVTAYVNRRSVRGSIYPDNGIAGVTIEGTYLKGHQGKNGNSGISASVARQNASLNPAKNDVLRVHLTDEASLTRLLDWYGGALA